MKNIITFTTLFFLLISNALLGQSRIYPPNLRAPENGEQAQSPDVLIDWDAVTGESFNITYELQLATNADFSDVTVFDGLEVTAWQMTDLQFGQTYFWRVKAFDDGAPSEWSETWSFSTASSVRIKKQPGPSMGGMVYANPLISWYKLTGLTGYELQIDTANIFVADVSGTEESINATFISDAGDKWAVGDNGLVLHFDGTQWITVDAGITDDLNDLCFVSETDAYLVGDGGLVVHFDGTDWMTVDVGTTSNLNGVSFVDANTGWAVGDDGITMKYDAGTWTEETTGNSKKLYDVFALNAGNVWACGESKTVMHFDGSEWTSETVGTKEYYGLWFVDENNGWIVGKSGKIFHFNGTEWAAQESGTSKDLYSVSFDANGTGYAVGKKLSSTGPANMVMYTGDWAAMAAGFMDDLYGIYSSGNQTLFGGKDGDLASSSDDGFNSPYVRTFPVPFDSGSYQLANLLFDKTFYYRMRAIHLQDVSEWSGPWSMKTYATTELNKPGNNDSDTELSLLFRWDRYEGATDYIFEIANDEDFTTSWTIPQDSNSVNFTVPLFDHEYFWRVKAMHPEDESEWTEVWSFTTTNTVELSSPENNAEEVNSCPKFTWVAIDGVSEYEIAVDLEEDFPNPKTLIVDDNFNQCQEAMEKNTIYYWKVRAVTGLDSSDWSDTWSFKTEGYKGIDDVSAGKAVRIFPNPSKGDFSLTINSLRDEVCKLSITDVSGKVLLEKDIVCYPGENKIDLSLNVGEGVYLVNVQMEKTLISKKLYLQ
jgi:photosystem II stability/assembly factor-like uncharacterized protein